jgi:hypothetical protein
MVRTIIRLTRELSSAGPATGALATGALALPREDNYHHAALITQPRGE